MSGFVVTVQPHRDAQWEIDSWKQKHEDAQTLAEQLVQPPYLNVAACVGEIGSSTSKPIFFPESVLTRKAGQ